MQINRPRSIVALCIVILVLLSCRPQIGPNLGVDGLRGKTLDGRSVQLAQVDAKGLIVNFYSPICAPCVDELPSLALLYKEAQARGYAMYMALDGHPAVNGLGEPADDVDQAAAFAAIKSRMEWDVMRYRIPMPVMIMDTSFSISSAGLITGTPETLFFKTKPLILDYTMVGPISSAANEKDLRADSRFRFALARLR